MTQPLVKPTYPDLTEQPPVVFDTNVFITAMLNPLSTSARAMHAAILSGAEIVQTPQTRAELREKLLGENVKPFLADRLSRGEREQFFHDVLAVTRLKAAAENFTGCRDVKDNMLVDAAIEARAGYLVTGDKDLLVLGQAQGITHVIQIVHATDYLRHCAARHDLLYRQQELAKAFDPRNAAVAVTYSVTQDATNDPRFEKAPVHYLQANQARRGKAPTAE